MARKKENKQETLSNHLEDNKIEINKEKVTADEEISLKELSKIQDEINKELIKEKSIKQKNKKQNPTYLFFSFFNKKLKEDKLYLFSFLITVAFLVVFSFSKLKNTEGYYDRQKSTETTETATPTVNPPVSNPTSDKKPSTNEEVDIASYVGIYSRTVTPTAPLKLSDTCTISEYQVIYQIKKDKTITKYLYNECLGTIKMWSDELSYVSSGGARYISANNVNFLFATNSMKEIDGETYKIDESITTLRESKKEKNTEITFYDNNIIIKTPNDLILLKGATISYQLSQKYTINNRKEQTVYKSDTEDTYNFIVYEEENKNCYTKEEIEAKEFVDGPIYTIYSIKYNTEKGLFDTEKEIVSRQKSDGCDSLNADLEILKK